MAELKSCPFCGGEAEIWEDKVFCTYVPQCKECNAQRGRYINKENAIKAWNTRKPMEAVVAELEKEKAIHTEHFHISLYKDYPEIKQMYEKVCLVIDKAISIVQGKE